MNFLRVLVLLVVVLCPALSLAQTTLKGAELPVRSAGTPETNGDLVFRTAGMAGGFIRLREAGEVSVEVDLGAGADATVWVDIAGERKRVPLEDGGLGLVFRLSPGTHLLRVVVDLKREWKGNAAGAYSGEIAVRDVKLDGACFEEGNLKDLFFAAADTFREHGRRGNARVHFQNDDGAPLPSGTRLEAKLVKGDFA